MRGVYAPPCERDDGHPLRQRFEGNARVMRHDCGKRVAHDGGERAVYVSEQRGRALPQQREPCVLMFEQVGQSPHTPTCRGGVTDGMPSSYTSLRTG